MAKALYEIKHICRLCLCMNEELLIPVLNIIDHTLTDDDIERFTGIRIFDHEEYISYAICTDCDNKLRKSVTFRTTCMNNNVRFRQLFDENIQRTTEKDGTKVDFTTVSLQKQTTICEISEIMYEIKSPNPCIETEYAQNNFDHCNKVSCSIKIPLEVSRDESIAVEKLNQEPHPNNSSKRTVKRIQRNCNLKENMITLCSETKRDTKSKRSKPRKQLCTICGKLIINMQNHILSHTKEQKFACSYCPMKCSRKTQLKLHIDAVHLKKIVQKCEICNRGFTHVTSYTAHMRAQHGVGESYECKACGIKFRHRGGLRGHNNRKHNDESNCKCPICGMQFQDKKGLKCHFRVHSTEKPFACKYCPKRFKGPYARRVHELTHSGIMFQCTLCDKSYRYKALFNDHMRKCHGEKDAKLTKQC